MVCGSLKLQTTAATEGEAEGYCMEFHSWGLHSPGGGAGWGCWPPVGGWVTGRWLTSSPLTLQKFYLLYRVNTYGLCLCLYFKWLESFGTEQSDYWGELQMAYVGDPDAAPSGLVLRILKGFNKDMVMYIRCRNKNTKDFLKTTLTRYYYLYSYN